jgi:hypothetical protein
MYVVRQEISVFEKSEFCSKLILSLSESNSITAK